MHKSHLFWLCCFYLLLSAESPLRFCAFSSPLFLVCTHPDFLTYKRGGVLGSYAGELWGLLIIVGLQVVRGKGRLFPWWVGWWARALQLSGVEDASKFSGSSWQVQSAVYTFKLHTFDVFFSYGLFRNKTQSNSHRYKNNSPNNKDMSTWKPSWHAGPSISCHL